MTPINMMDLVQSERSEGRREGNGEEDSVGEQMKTAEAMAGPRTADHFDISRGGGKSSLVLSTVMHMQWDEDNEILFAADDRGQLAAYSLSAVLEELCKCIGKTKKLTPREKKKLSGTLPLSLLSLFVVAFLSFSV